MEFFYLIPIALALGAVGLAAFMWSLRSGQYDDLDGAAERILFEDEDTPASPGAEEEPATIASQAASALARRQVPREH
jgi:cbb3-type cytochrome oxidase maturation protein